MSADGSGAGVDGPGTGEDVLGWALRPAAATGSNLRGEASGAGWLYACPWLHVERTVCVGAPTVAELAGLAQASTTVLVVDANPARRRRTTVAAARRRWANVAVVAPTADTDADPVDLLVLSSSGRGRWVGPTWARYAALLVDQGLTFGLPDTPAGRRAVPTGAAVLSLRLAPRLSEPRSAVPSHDDVMQATLRRMQLEGTVARRPKVARLERRLSRRSVTRGRHRLLTGPFAGAETQVPEYLRRIAADAGVDLTDWSWGVAARGEYESQKVLVLLTPPGAGAPAGLVKLTRAAGHAHRLRNERAALQQVALLPAFADRAPAMWFAGDHADRWLLGQTMLAGRPYPAGTDWSPQSPALQDTFAALQDLSASTATAVPGAALCTALGRLLHRYEEVYRPADAEREALEGQLQNLRDLPGPLPVVLQHGDPHPGNLLLSEQGRTGFLDWESADRRGMPLGDSLYFFRSYAAAASRRDGLRDGVRGAARHMVDGSALGDRLVEALQRDASRIGLPAAAVLPLAHMCWVHRALKEATRTPPGRLATAPSVRLLRTMLARPDGGTLRQLRPPGG